MIDEVVETVSRTVRSCPLLGLLELSLAPLASRVLLRKASC